MVNEAKAGKILADKKLADANGKVKHFYNISSKQNHVLMINFTLCMNNTSGNKS